MKYGQTRASGDADCRSWSRAAPGSRSLRLPPALAAFHCRAAGLCARAKGHIHRAARARRALHLALRRRNPGHRPPRAPPLSRCRGTELDGANGAGRFRVLLHVEDKQGHQDWAAQGAVAVAQWHDAVIAVTRLCPAWRGRSTPETWTELPDFSRQQPALTGESTESGADAQGFTALRRGVGRIHRYSRRRWLHLSPHRSRRRAPGDRRRGSGQDRPAIRPGLRLTGQRASATPEARSACAPAAHFSSGGAELASDGAPRLLWEGPGLPLTDVPPAAYSHLRQDGITK